MAGKHPILLGSNFHVYFSHPDIPDVLIVSTQYLSAAEEILDDHLSAGYIKNHAGKVKKTKPEIKSFKPERLEYRGRSHN